MSVFLLFSGLFIDQGQAAIVFSSTDQYTVPNQNSTIRFISNGSFSSATIEEETWTFRDLNLNNSSATFLGLETVSKPQTHKFSAKNSNVSIIAFQTFNYSAPITILSYLSEGEGTQTANLGLNVTRSTDSSEWSIIVEDNIFLGEGQGWSLLPDNTVVISKAAHNITIVHFNFRTASTENVGFLLQHYVIFFTSIVLASTIGLAIIVKFRRQRLLKKIILETQISNQDQDRVDIC